MMSNCKSGDLKRAAVLVLSCAATAIALQAQTFTTLVNFEGSNGANPAYESLVQRIDGNLYGTTSYGDANHYPGTLFKMTFGGVLTTLHNFTKFDGAGPEAGLVLATNGTFYGTTSFGGANNHGTIFKITPRGTLTTLNSFDFTNGSDPYSGLVQATNGDFYGTTVKGGTSTNCLNGYNCGTVFKITPAGVITTLHSFDLTDGAWPSTGLVQANNGNFYGIAAFGGGNSYFGTIFEITPSGTLTTLHDFNGIDGAGGFGGLVQGSNGYLYGTTTSGGAGNGTVFKISLNGTFTTVHSFNGTDGVYPYDTLVQGSDGNFYGTTHQGGTNGFGTIFRMTPGGTATALHSFDQTDGSYPYGGLMQATDGAFYGTTTDGGAYGYEGGAYGYGTVFKLTVGLPPFVKTLPTSGKVGSKVTILGTNLTGTTSITFNGTPVASFTVNPTGSAISTTVPTGATTGKVQVVTPSGTLSSNVVFRVR